MTAEYIKSVHPYVHPQATIHQQLFSVGAMPYFFLSSGIPYDFVMIPLYVCICLRLDLYTGGLVNDILRYSSLA
jgi:hypothetical protein